MKKALIIILSINLLCCCQNGDENVTVNISIQQNNSTITKSKAIDLAINAYYFINEKTRSISYHEVSDVYPWRYCEIYGGSRSIENTSNLPDTLLYIVNFAEDNGFALVSACKQIDNVVALIDKGHLSPDCESENPGFRLFLNRLRDYISNEISLTEDNNITNNIEYGDWTTVAVYPPILTTKWNQSAPFNNYCYTSTGKKAVAGCVAIAASQIIAYHRSPKSHNGHSYLWEYIMDGTTPQTKIGCNSVAHLVSDVGQLVQMNYGEKASSAFSSNVKDCFDALGFHYSYVTNGSIFERCMSNITQNRPIYIRGEDENSGHAWVIDGSAVRKRDIYTYTTPNNKQSTETEFQYLLHCNWGWGGSFDGYFISNVFDPYNRQADDNLTTTRASFIKNHLYYDIYPN